ncbi:hypothetical protein B0H66DRAFT_608581 [Apodospora peruviana]|uniref:Cyanovirin-N domain-containing protein n=1 Tax=Apodospora peruviana TaxID=516989 RepID=A0AAE0HUP0_9PEZI|nr:hypothetical protein B0H66DRAFT_608581 [Apodospora peruviana]
MLIRIILLLTAFLTAAVPVVQTEENGTTSLETRDGPQKPITWSFPVGRTCLPCASTGWNFPLLAFMCSVQGSEDPKMMTRFSYVDVSPCFNNDDGEVTNKTLLTNHNGDFTDTCNCALVYPWQWGNGTMVCTCKKSKELHEGVEITSTDVYPLGDMLTNTDGIVGCSGANGQSAQGKKMYKCF